MLLLKTFNSTPRYDLGPRRIWLIDPCKMFLFKVCHVVDGSSKLYSTRLYPPFQASFSPLLSKAMNDFYIFKCLGKEEEYFIISENYMNFKFQYL